MRFFKKKEAAPERKSRAMMLGMRPYSGIGSDFATYALEGYAQNPIAFACISKIANAISSVDFNVYQEKNGKLEKIENHPLEKLIDKPNNKQSGRGFIRDLVTQYLIGGNAFVYGVGMDAGRTQSPPKGLFILNCDKVKIERGADKPLSYIYKPTIDVETKYDVNLVTGHSSVLHLKTANPLDDFVGLPPMTAAAYGVDILNSGLKWNKKLIDNDCRPAGTLMMEGVLSNEQFDRLKENITDQFAGSSNAGKPLLLKVG